VPGSESRAWSTLTGMNVSGERPHFGVLGVPFEEDTEMAGEMAGLAKRFVERGRENEAILDFSDSSIDVADGIGLQMYEALPRAASGPKLEELRSALASELGAYFGETFIRNHGGRWGWVAGSGTTVFGLRTEAGINAFPVIKARKRMSGAENESLAVVYAFLCRWQETQGQKRASR
jgi:hypothetical protein